MGAEHVRTLLEQLVRQRHWSLSDFCRQYAQASQEIFDRCREVSPQTASRWLGAKLKGLPYPAQQRVLEKMFGIAVADLFGPPGVPGCAVTPGPRDPDEEVATAAAESARFLMTTEHTNVGPHTLDQLTADLRHLIVRYPNRPVYPLFVELRELRNRAFLLLEGHQRPDQTRDLYLLAGTVCGVLANASFDLGHLAAAETQARTAFLCAELAGHNGLRVWIRGTQSLVAYWDDRPRAAVDHALSGYEFTPESGTALVRLAAIEARARGRLHDKAGVKTALARAVDARDAVTRVDEFGGMMAFPEAKQLFYAATARLWLGDAEAIGLAQDNAQSSVTAYAQARPKDRRGGEENLARLDLAATRLYGFDSDTTNRRTLDLDGAAAQIRTVLDMAIHRPIDSVTRRLRQVAAVLDHPRLHGSRLAQALQHEIAVHTDHRAVPALPAGDLR